ncbi:MAG: MTH938/NDUFAF3 family protein [Deltaproteobacteria bacterium]|nr:MTH938/NDUFAF3 family protein [Deltaproteobacteria bacterium]
MKIDSHSFGNISMGGKIYTTDLIISPAKIINPWWRQEGHLLQMVDLREIIEESFDLLIIGIGYYGRMKVSEKILHDLQKRGIDIRIELTPKAIDLFNKVSDYRKTVLCLHLSC